MKTLQITPETVGWEQEISAHLAAGDRVEVRIETPLLSPAQFGERMGLSRTAVTNWIERGQIRAEKHGSYWKIPESEVERFRAWYIMKSAAEMVDDL